MRHGAAALAVGHCELGGQRARVVLAVDRRVPGAGHDARVGVGHSGGLEPPRGQALLAHLRRWRTQVGAQEGGVVRMPKR